MRMRPGGWGAMRVVNGIGLTSSRTLRTCSLLLLCAAMAAAGRGGDKKHLFLIRVTPPVNPESVQVHYYLTGDFGGYGGFQVETHEQEIAIRLDQTSKPPKSLKAVLYAPGCEINLIRADDLKNGDREAQFDCHPLPAFDIPAAFPRPAALTPYQLDVEVDYIAPWTHEFFGEGAAMRIMVGSVTAGRDGSFRLHLPDFSKDPLYSTLGKNAELHFYVRERSSGNVVAELKGPDPLTLPSGGMRIDAQYPAPLSFSFLASR